MIKKAFTAVFLLILNSPLIYGFSYNWCTDNPTPSLGSGVYPNVDNSGVEIKIDGLKNYRCYSTEKYPSSIKTGINDRYRGIGVVHHYQFQFSRPVDVSFLISDITVLGGDHEDYLLFSGNPIFSDPYNVIITENEVKSYSQYVGWIWVTYNNVTSFSFSHGSGELSPGFIILSPLEFYTRDIIPNVFSPNDDGQNDRFTFFATLENPSVKIYNRWGDLVYETTSNMVEWDGTSNGKKLPEGVYFLVYTGSEGNKKRVENSSFVHLLY